jgi:hypothetical protein
MKSWLTIARAAASVQRRWRWPLPPWASRTRVHRHRRDGKTVSLADFKGKARGAGVGQPRLPLRAEALRRRQHAGHAEGAVDKGVVWLAINSTAPTMRLQGAGRPGGVDEVAEGRRHGHADGQPTARSAAPTARAPRRTCTSSTPPAPWSTPARSTASQRQPGRHRRRHQPREAGAGRIAGRQAGQRCRTRPYGCSVKYSAAREAVTAQGSVRTARPAP